MEFRILGPLEVTAGDQLLNVGGARTRAVLALLVVRANQVVSAEALAAELWPDLEAERATANLHVRLSELRRVLRSAGEGDLVETQSPGYVLRVGPDQVDATRFGALVGDGRALLHAGDAIAAAGRFDEALALWRGPPLAGMDDLPWARAEATRLEEARLTALELQVDAKLASGRHGELVGELEALTGAHQLRERFWAQRMMALYRAGRQADALRAYQQLRGILGEELGIEPSQDLTRLEEAILLQKPELDWTPSPEGWTPAPLPSGPVTFLLTDIEGSTVMWERSPDEMRLALARHDAVIADAVARHEGVLVKSQGEGDATFSVFDRAPDAVATSIDVQREIAGEPWPTGAALRVRMSIHTGEADLRDGDYFGPVVNRAARLRSAGHGGQVLLSASTAQLVRDCLPAGGGLRDLGSRRLKGLAGPEPMFQLLHPDLPVAFPPVVVLDERPLKAPIPPTPLIGRDRELRAAMDMIRRDGVRLLTLVGPGGVGKTRLALELAHTVVDDVEDGVWFVALAGVTDPTVIVDAVAAALEVREQPGRSLYDSVVAAIGRRQVLLVLDNFEQVIDGAVLVADLLAACPRLVVLATSREALRLRAEHVLAVPPLSVPAAEGPVSARAVEGLDAVALLVERARAARSTFELDDANAAVVAQICIRLDGLPLAIELAAARLRTLEPAALLDRLDAALDTLTDGPRDMPERHRALRATITWSYDLLTEDERRLLRGLSVFPSGCTMEAADAVCGEGASVRATAESLVDKSLLRWEGDDGEVRLVMLATIREFAAEQRDDTADDVAERHADLYLSYAAELPSRDGTPDFPVAAMRLEREMDNLRAAMAWRAAPVHDPPDESTMAGLRVFWRTRGHLTEGFTWAMRLAGHPGAPAMLRCGIAAMASSFAAAVGHAEDARAACRIGLAALDEPSAGHDPESPIGRAALLDCLGEIAGLEGHYDEAAARFEEALEFRRAAGSQLGVMVSHQNIAALALSCGNSTRAAAHCREMAAIIDREPWGPMVGHNLLLLVGGVAWLDEDFAGAVESWTQSLDRSREQGDLATATQALQLLAHQAQLRGVGEAVGLSDEALAIARELADVPEMQRALTTRAAILAEAGRFADARESLDEAAALGSARDATAVGTFRLTAARCHIAAGASAQALGDAGASLDAYRVVGDPRTIVLALTTMAAAQRELGEVSAAARSLIDAMSTARDLGGRLAAAVVFEESARLFESLGDADVAGDTWAAGALLRAQLGVAALAADTPANLGRHAPDGSGPASTVAETIERLRLLAEVDLPS